MKRQSSPFTAVLLTALASLVLSALVLIPMQSLQGSLGMSPALLQYLPFLNATSPFTPQTETVPLNFKPASNVPPSSMRSSLPVFPAAMAPAAGATQVAASQNGCTNDEKGILQKIRSLKQPQAVIARMLARIAPLLGCPVPATSSVSACTPGTFCQNNTGECSADGTCCPIPECAGPPPHCTYGRITYDSHGCSTNGCGTLVCNFPPPNQ